MEGLVDISDLSVIAQARQKNKVPIDEQHDTTNSHRDIELKTF